jgi:hypothetical protein
VIGQAKGGITISAGSPGLLIIIFERAGELIVDHQPHVRPIDAHPEGVRGHNQGSRMGEKIFLNSRPLFRRNPRVIGLGPNSEASQPGTNRIYTSPGRGVDQTRSPETTKNHGDFSFLSARLRPSPRPLRRVFPGSDGPTQI